ncbi:MAG TPA: LacI family DNA-binding transcriptional regulator [Arenibaculum sp.]|nr:LacI family DNA-binding transcriptional regulator [Arenibaculum sp.]
MASAAGVSTATVSRALSEPHRVNAQTRDKVLSAVRELGYTPNAAARNLRARRSMMALCVVPTLANPFFAEVVRGVDAGLSAAGYGMIIGDLDNVPDKGQHLVDLATAGHIDGAVVLSGRIPQKDGRSMLESGIPHVAVCAEIPSPEIPSVLVDERRAVRAVVSHLIALGHKRFAYLSGPAANYNDRERWAGFCEALAASGLPPEAGRRLEGDFSTASGAAAARRLLADRRGETAAVAMSDEMAIGFVKVMHGAGLRVPGDISVTGFDGIVFADYCEPTLSTIRQPRFELGRRGAELLVRLLRGEEVPARTVLESELLWRDSTAAPRLSPS